MSDTAQRTSEPADRRLLDQALSHVSRGELVQADRILSSALDSATDDPQYLQLLGIVRRLQGQLPEAEDLYRRSLAILPNQPHVHHNLGNLLRSLRRYEDAVAAQREAIRLKPNYAEAHLDLALALSDMDDHAGAEKSCRDALRYQPNYLAAKQALAMELCELDRAKEAEQLLRRALAIGVPDPRQTAALEHNLAMALKQQRRFEDALLLFDAAQAKAPDLPAVDFNRGNTLQQLARNEEAAHAYARAIARDPDHVASLAGYALTSAVVRDFVTARNAAARALSLHPDHPVARVAFAITEIEAGEFSAADANLHSVISHPSFKSDGLAGRVLGYAGDALERKSRYARAFDIYRLSNSALRASYTRLPDTRAMHDVKRLTAYIRSCRSWTASATPPMTGNMPAAHVFVLGFMRSGTTLLETVLSTNPKVTGIDELEFLTEATRELLLGDDGLFRLENLSPEAAAPWCNAYWKDIREAGYSIAGKTFIDKMPFNSLRLPLIARLFPSARVIFAIRDPRDVVISCFRRRFKPTAFTYEFLDLEDCAHFYAACMTLSELYRDKLPLNILDFRYEDMIGNFDESVRKVCVFADIEYDLSMRNFGSKAQVIDSRSVSAPQVRRGLYAEGIGQWRHYREQMEPVLPILKPWIERFGYSYE